jgi:RNA polymerase sigma factor (sigma-70 family)
MSDNQETAEDITDETLFIAMGVMPDFDKNRNREYCYLRSIARNRYIDIYVRHNKEKVSYDCLIETKTILECSEEIENILIDRLVIRDAVNRLPEIYQTIINKYYKGYSGNDGARLLDLTTAAYKGRLYRALKLLKKIL